MTATRYYSFGGATVAVRQVTTTDKFWLLLGDSQGSAQVMMPATISTSGDLEPATTADATAALRNLYAPNETELTDNSTSLTTSHGWLNQVADGTTISGGTGLIYLNARYYDALLGRFISPDPLMNPADPRTLDPYRYADNNPVTYSDATGLCPGCSLDQIALYGASTSGNLSNLGAAREADLRASVTQSLARSAARPPAAVSDARVAAAGAAVGDIFEGMGAIFYQPPLTNEDITGLYPLPTAFEDAFT